MAKSGSFLLVTVLALCLLGILLFLGPKVEARSGGERIGSRYSRRQYRTRTYSSSGGGTRIGGMRWKMAAATGNLYGFHRYTTRPSYRKHPDTEPTICVNTYDYKRSNGTNYTYFICPSYQQPDSYTHCCGPSDRQSCCSDPQ